jgi:hypothetical protein
MDNSTDQKSFLKHVFNFDDDSKSELLNIIQYAILAIIPVIVLNKTPIPGDCVSIYDFKPKYVYEIVWNVPPGSDSKLKFGTFWWGDRNGKWYQRGCIIGKNDLKNGNGFYANKILW